MHDVALGQRFTCAVVTGGGVRCWGQNHQGQLGYGHTQSIGDDESPASAGNVDVQGQVVQVAAGVAHTCVLFTSGEVTCWGDVAGGRLGFGDSVLRDRRAELTGLTEDVGDDETPAAEGRLDLGGPAVQLAAGNTFTCALLLGGDVRCWGNNSELLGYAITGGGVRCWGENHSWVTVIRLQSATTNRPRRNVDAGRAVAHTCVLFTSGEVTC